jgi:hypothetical protein
MFKMFRLMIFMTVAATVLLLGAGLMAMGYLGYGSSGDKDDKTARLPASASQVVDEAAERVADSLPDPQTPQTVYIPPIRGDRDDQTLRLRIAQAIDESGKYQAITETLTEKALSWANLSGPGEQLPSDAEAREAAKSASANAALVVEVSKFKTSDPPQVKMAWKLVDAGEETSLPLVVDRLDHSPDNPDPKISSSPTAYRAGGRRGPVGTGWALLIWVGSALLVPVALAGGLSKVLAKESNFINGFLLIAMTIGDVVLALFLMGWKADGFLDALIVLSAFGLGGAYNYLVLEKLEDMRF